MDTIKLSFFIQMPVNIFFDTVKLCSKYLVTQTIHHTSEILKH